MNLNRLDQLQKFLEEDPSDPFAWYALALEYQRNDTTKALQLFDKLLTDFESYIPTYYQAAHLYLHIGELEKAMNILEKGHKLAKQKNDVKTMAELKSALDELEG